MYEGVNGQVSGQWIRREDQRPWIAPNIASPIAKIGRRQAIDYYVRTASQLAETSRLAVLT